MGSARIAGGALLLASALSILPAQTLTVQDGTPVRLRLMRTVSSADAHEGETVDFEVAEPVAGQSLIVIPKGSVAWGKVVKAEPKRRFGRTGELQISIDSVRLTDGSRAPLRATQEKGTGPMGSGRLAATIVATPAMVWVKGKDVVFEKGMEITAYLNGDTRVDEAQLRGGLVQPVSAAQAPPATAGAPGNPGALTNRDVVEMAKAGLSEDVILAKIRTSNTDFRSGAQDLIQLKEAGVGDAVISLIVEKSSVAGRR